MKKSKTIALPNNSFARILGIPAAILAVPFATMLLGGLNWDETDFIAVGIILIVAVGLLELAMKVKGKARVYTVAAIILGALWLYVELAVGLFTNWGS